jgi:hypothetical protein
VSQLRSDDYVGVCVNRRCQDVPVVAIRKTQSLNQSFIAGHESVGCVKVHQLSGSLDLLARQVGTTAQQRANPLLMYRSRPLRPKEASQSEVHEQVSKVGGV